MNVQQRLKILFLPKNSKKNKEGSPLWVRITIDGLKKEFALDVRVKSTDWDKKTKTVKDSAPKYKEINDKINDARTDIKRHFLLVQAKKTIALPEDVIKSYQSPVNGNDLQEQKTEYENFQCSLLLTVEAYLAVKEKYKKLKDQSGSLSLTQEKEMQQEHQKFTEEIKELAKRAFKIYGDKERPKTLVMAIDEYLFNFLQQVHTGSRKYTTLEKWVGRRNRYINFLEYRFKKEDLPLNALEFSFMDDLVTYCKLIHEVNENTAFKYAKCLKEVIKRIVSKGWIAANPFATFKCPYVDPKPIYLSMEQYLELKNHNFKKDCLNELKKCYIFACFTGLSYAELHNLDPQKHIYQDGNGEWWITINRDKTDSEEALPMLPPAVEIMEGFKNHPKCVRKSRVLPMPTNEHWNRSLKLMGEDLGFNLVMRGHQTRYFFANEVAYNNDVEIPVKKQMLSHKKMRTTEHYLRGNKKRMKAEMQTLKKKLFDEQGQLRVEVDTNSKTIHPNLAKIITLKRG